MQEGLRGKERECYVLGTSQTSKLAGTWLARAGWTPPLPEDVVTGCPSFPWACSECGADTTALCLHPQVLQYLQPLETCSTKIHSLQLLKGSSLLFYPLIWLGVSVSSLVLQKGPRLPPVKSHQLLQSRSRSVKPIQKAFKENLPLFSPEFAQC